MSVKENLFSITERLGPDVMLVAVSKTKPPALIMEAYEAGHRDFGENYVQELTEKHALLPGDIRWHFIGHLQSNKVKYIAPFVHLIHGIDSLKLLVEVDRQAQKAGRTIDCLLQIHIASEETKFGLSFEECEEILASETFAHLKHVKVLGFMGMATNTKDSDQIRREFSNLRLFYDRVNENVLQLSTLSIGMSSDFEIALECGSNMLRIGSTIFGERDYSKR